MRRFFTDSQQKQLKLKVRKSVYESGTVFFFLSEGLRKILEREVHNEKLNIICALPFMLLG
jgi:hypothetical protein